MSAFEPKADGNGIGGAGLLLTKADVHGSRERMDASDVKSGSIGQHGFGTGVGAAFGARSLIRARTVAFISDENAGCAPARSNREQRDAPRPRHLQGFGILASPSDWHFADRGRWGVSSLAEVLMRAELFRA